MSMRSRSNNMRSRSMSLHARAFTITELLAVIGVISVLLALIVPATSSVRASARASSCQANLRQIGIAATTYAVQNKECFPAAILYEQSPLGIVTKAWDFDQHPDGTVRTSALWDFTSAGERVQQCPEFEGASTFGADPATGYNYNTTYIGAEGRFPELGDNGAWLDGWRVARLGLRAGQVRKTATTVLFGEGGWKGGANKFMRAPSATVENDFMTIYSGAQAFRHTRATHVCFIDGHVKSSCECHDGVHASPQLVSDILDFPKNGFLDDLDGPYDPR